jgi:hypothetical protein
VKRRTNAAMARGIASTEPDAASWHVFDALPRQVRVALWAAPLPINPVQVRDLVRAYGVDDALSALADAIRSEVDTYAADHARRHGSPLPHVAARASLQGYEAAVRRCRTRLGRHER